MSKFNTDLLGKMHKSLPIWPRCDSEKYFSQYGKRIAIYFIVSDT